MTISDEVVTPTRTAEEVRFGEERVLSTMRPRGERVPKAAIGMPQPSKYAYPGE